VSVRHVAFLIKALLVCVLERIFSFFPSLSVTPGELIQHSNFRCISCSKRSDLMAVLYSSLRTTVTIGPSEAYEPHQEGCMFLVMTQIALSYFLAIVVIANIISLLPRRDGTPS
jgi:hypothetical protein